MADRLSSEEFIDKLKAVRSSENKVEQWQLFAFPSKGSMAPLPEYVMVLKRNGLPDQHFLGPEPSSDDWYGYVEFVKEMEAILKPKPTSPPFTEPIAKVARDAYVELSQLLFEICSAGYMARVSGMLKGLKAEIDFDKEH